MNKLLFSLFLFGAAVGLYLALRDGRAEPEDLAGETKPIIPKA